jgi:hypothetical protein
VKKYKVVTYEDTVYKDADTFSFGEMFFLIKDNEKVFGCPISELDHFEVVDEDPSVEEKVEDTAKGEFVINTLKKSEGEKIREVIDQYLEEQVRMGNL